MGTARAPGRRLPGLDLLRAAAIAWVMLYHLTLFDLLPNPDHWVVQYGWMGVDIFFVLSGYLIASQLLQPIAAGGTPRYGNFFSRRILRTFPAYLAVLAVYFLVPGTREMPSIQAFWRFASFTANMLVTLDSRTFSHAWSLCVEEQFYLVLPVFVVCLSRRPTPRKVVLTLLAVLAFGMAVRGSLWLWRVAATPFDIHAAPDWRPFMRLIYYPTWGRLDGLLAGVATAVLRVFRPGVWDAVTRRANTLLAAGIVGIGGAMLLFTDLIAGFWATVFGYPLLSVSIALVVAAATTSRSLIGRYRMPGARRLATGSYSLYLSHKLAYHAVASGLVPTFGFAGVARCVEAVVLAASCGAALYWAIEWPFLKLRDRLDGPARSSIAAQAASGGEDGPMLDPVLLPTSALRVPYQPIG